MVLQWGLCLTSLLQDQHHPMDHTGNAGGSRLQLQAKGKGQSGAECPCWELWMPWMDPVRSGCLPTYLVSPLSHSQVGEGGLPFPVRLQTGSAFSFIKELLQT